MMNRKTPEINTEKICFLIDDDLDDQEIFSLALKEVNENFKCLTANSGYDALQKLTFEGKFIPDYIFLDLNMPRMNGKECLRELKKFEHLNKIPVIIYSTSSSQKDRAETYHLGATDFITKPFSVSELTSMLIDLFEAHKKQPAGEKALG